MVVMLAAVLGVAAAPPVPAGQTAPPPGGTPTATALADHLEQRNRTLADLKRQATAVAAALAVQRTRVRALEAHTSGLGKRAAELVASAQQAALASYMQADPVDQPFALALILGSSDANDAAWSLGLLKITHQYTLGLLRQARAARGGVDQELADAIRQRDALVAEGADVRAAIAAADVAVVDARNAVDVFTLRIAPTTVEGLTTVAYDAYQRAAAAVAIENPACGLRWELLAAIGKTESNHGFGRLAPTGASVRPIIGISIGPDTDGGRLDGDAARDHAVGPMQFLPSTWNAYGADGNGDGIADPGNIFDAALAAGRFLCRAARPLTLLTRAGVIRAIWAYNPNEEYLRVVGARFEALARDVANGWFSRGDLPVPQVPTPTGSPPGIDGGLPPQPIDTTTNVPAPATVVHTVSVFSANGLAVATAGGITPAACAPPSAVLAARQGFVRCTLAGAAGAAQTLDPCSVAPFDATLAACLPDPTAPARLVRTAAPMAVIAATPAPPYRALELTGGDMCAPIAPAGAPAPPAPPAPATTTTAATTTTTTTTRVGHAAPLPTSTTARPTTVGPTSTTRATTTTVTSGPTATTAPTTTTRSTTTTRPPTTTARPTTTTGATPTVTTTAAATPAGSSYRCRSGATVVGQPDRSAAVWQAVVSQPGIAARPVPVSAAWT
jgi:membrane-bound lytic murein transglycosylase B